MLGTLSVVPTMVEAAEWPVKTPEEIAAALKDARPGDEIVMRDGPWRDAEILFEAGGTPEQPITLRARTPGKVIISGRSRLRIAGSHLVEISYLRDFTLPTGERSLSYRLTIGAPDRTLSAEEAGAIRGSIIDGMRAAGYDLRV